MRYYIIISRKIQNTQETLFSGSILYFQSLSLLFCRMIKTQAFIRYMMTQFDTRMKSNISFALEKLPRSSYTLLRMQHEFGLRIIKYYKDQITCKWLVTQIRVHVNIMKRSMVKLVLCSHYKK